MLERVNKIWDKISKEKETSVAPTNPQDIIYTGDSDVLKSMFLGEHQKMSYLRNINWQLLKSLTDPKRLASLTEKERFQFLSFFNQMEKESRNFELAVMELCAKNSWAEKLFKLQEQEEKPTEVKTTYVPEISEERRKELTEMLRDKINETVRSRL